MSEPFVFDSRCTYCKEPFGAVECGTPVSFRCRPLSGEGFVRCTLVLHHEFADKVYEVEMLCSGIEGQRTCFTAIVPTPAQAELIWYSFRFHRPDGSVVCRCETVTEGEILDAIRRPLGAKSLDGVKRRTRAGMGRCQAGFCSPRVMELLARELGVDQSAVTKAGGASRLIVGQAKDSL